MNIQLINNKYKLLEKIGNGSFGSIYKAENCRTKETVAVKIELIVNETNLLKNESKIYQYLLGTQGIPQIKWYGKDDTNYYMVINLLGKSLEQLLNDKHVFSLKLILQIGIQLIQLLKTIHEKGLIHRDIKPDNFLLGNDETNNKTLFLIDFGLCKSYMSNGNHIKIKKTNGIIGSLTYASLNSHENTELSRRDDLESLGYMLTYFSLGTLPWRETINYNDIISLKKEIIYNKNIPNILKEFMIIIRNLSFEEKPMYEFFIHKFHEEIISINNLKII
jgi:serine/threonine protein kinase